MSTDTKAIEAIMDGLERFQATMLSKPYDQAIFIITSLRSAGLKIVRDPRPRRTTIDELVRIHCKAEGPVSLKSIYLYVASQLPAPRPMIEDVENAVNRLVSNKVIAVYEPEWTAADTTATYW